MLIDDTTDPQIEARAAGYDWSEINNHLGQASLAASDAGYTQDEIDQHLGFKDPATFAARATGSWGSAFAENPDLFPALRSPDKPFDLTENSQLPFDYAAALSENEVKGPQDFADRYAAEAINAVHPDDWEMDPEISKRRLQSMAGSTTALGYTLPSRSDVIDAALSLVSAPAQVMPVFRNLMDHWATTGQQPVDAAIEAQQNPELLQNIVGGDAADVNEPGVTNGPHSDPDSILSRVAQGFGSAFGKMFQEEPTPFEPEKMGKAEVGGAILGSLAGVIPGQIVKAATAGGRALEATMTQGPGAADPQDILTGAMLGMEMKIPGGRPIHLEEVPGLDKPVEVVRPELPAGEPGAVETKTLAEALAPTRPADVDAPIPMREQDQTQVRPVKDVLAQIKEEKETEAANRLMPILEKFGEESDEYQDALIAEEKRLGYRPPGLDTRVGANDNAPPQVRSKVTLGEGEGTASGAVTHDILDDTGNNIGFITLKHAGADTPDIPAGTARVQMITSNSITGEQLGPRAVRDLARQYFEQNPDINKLEGFRISGARERAGTQAEASVTRDQVMGPGKRFDPEATPAEKVEALARDAGEHNSDPEFFRKLAQDEDPATKKLASAYDFVSGLWKVFKDVFADESGSLNIFKPSAARTLEGETKAESFNYAYKAIRFVGGRVEDWSRHFETPDSVHKLINKDLSEFKDAFKSGDPLKTKMGDLINRLAGSGTSIISKSSPQWAVVQHYYDVSARLANRMQTAIRQGLYTEADLRRKLVLSSFNETSGALAALDRGEFVTAVSHPRTILQEGLALGLTPRELHPIDFHERLVGTVARNLEQGRAAQTAEKAGFIYRDRVATDGTKDREIANTEKFIYNPATKKTERTALFGDPSFARQWNRAFEAPRTEAELRAQVFAKKMQYWANQSAVVKLFLPFYHAGTMVKESYSGTWALWGDLAATGQWAALGKEVPLGLGAPVTLPLRASKAMAEYYKTGVPSKEMRDLIDVNGLQVRRPNLYKSLSEQQRPFTDSLRKGSLKNEIMNDVRAMWPDNGSALFTKGVLAPFRSLELMAKELGRLYTSIPFLNGFWEKYIPYTKMGTNLLRQRYAIEADKFQTVEKRRLSARQIADDTDNRMGEMNQDNIMWPKWVKNVLNTVFISAVSWKYGTMRMTAAAFGLNTDKMFGGLGLHSLEWNPYATRSMLAMLFSNALINSSAQWLMTGKFPTPWDERPIMDKIQQAMTPWFGGILAKGAKELIMTPGQEKEFMDWAKIWQAGIMGAKQRGPGAGLLEFVKALGDYAFSGMIPPFQAIKDLYFGEDAIGNKIKVQTGGMARYLTQQFEPIFKSTMGQRKVGTAVPAAGSFIGMRPAGSWWNDPQNYWDGRARADARAEKEQIARERRDVSQLETPPDWAADIPAKADPAGRPVSSSGAKGFANPGGFGGPTPNVARGSGGSGFANPGGGGEGSGFANPGAAPAGTPSSRRSGGRSARSPRSSGDLFNNLRGVRRNRGNRRRA